MTFQVYKLIFNSPLHISKGKINSYESSNSVIHSDTLKAAFFVCAKMLFDEGIAKKLHDKILFSSAFPFDKIKEGEESKIRYWLPRPLGYQFPDETAENRKAYKKVQFLEVAQYSKLLNGETPLLMKKDNGEFHQPEIWKKDVTQRVKISHNGDSDPFYLEKLYPVTDKGVYFIYHTEGGDLTAEEHSQFDASMRLLGDNGIGLQRGLGNGQFSIEKGSFLIQLPQNATQWVSLSLYRPESKEQIEGIIKKSVYQFVKRGGWLNAPESDEHLTIRKRSVMMFTEGSIFSFGEKPIEGKIEDLKPDYPIGHSVWRDGRGFFLPIV